MLPSIYWEEITKLISARLYTLGFDLVKAFPAQRSIKIQCIKKFK